MAGRHKEWPHIGHQIIFRGELAQNIITGSTTKNTINFYQLLGKIGERFHINILYTKVSLSGTYTNEANFKADAVQLNIPQPEGRVVGPTYIDERDDEVIRIIKEKGGEICTHEVHQARRNAAAERRRGDLNFNV